MSKNRRNKVVANHSQQDRRGSSSSANHLVEVQAERLNIAPRLSVAAGLVVAMLLLGQVVRTPAVSVLDSALSLHSVLFGPSESFFWLLPTYVFLGVGTPLSVMAISFVMLIVAMKHRIWLPFANIFTGISIVLFIANYVLPPQFGRLSASLPPRYSYPNIGVACAVSFYGFIVTLCYCYNRNSSFRPMSALILFAMLIDSSFMALVLERAWLTDVIGGALFGGAVLLVAQYLLEKIRRGARPARE